MNSLAELLKSGKVWAAERPQELNKQGHPSNGARAQASSQGTTASQGHPTNDLPSTEDRPRSGSVGGESMGVHDRLHDRLIDRLNGVSNQGHPPSGCQTGGWPVGETVDVFDWSQRKNGLKHGGTCQKQHDNRDEREEAVAEVCIRDPLPKGSLEDSSVAGLTTHTTPENLWPSVSSCPSSAAVDPTTCLPYHVASGDRERAASFSHLAHSGHRTVGQKGGDPFFSIPSAPEKPSSAECETTGCETTGCENGSREENAEDLLSFGIDAIDSALPGRGLHAGSLHEFTYEEPLFRSSLRRWTPPFLPLLPFFSQLASKSEIGSKLQRPASARSHQIQDPLWPEILWIGRRCWPTPFFLLQAARHAHLLQGLSETDTSETFSSRWLKQHCFIDLSSSERRTWSALQAIASGAPRAIILDGCRLSFLQTRRLQIAARNTQIFIFVLRPPWEINCTSVARTRWQISPCESPLSSYRWTLRLVKARGLARPISWTIEWQRTRYGEKHFVCLSTELLDRAIDQEALDSIKVQSFNRA